jgi:hypothetical protein
MRAKHTSADDAIPPSRALYRAVLAGFIMADTTLTAWCRENGLDRAWARQCLLGMRDGPAARALRRRIAEAAGALLP